MTNKTNEKKKKSSDLALLWFQPPIFRPQWFSKLPVGYDSLRKAYNLINSDDTDVSLAAFGRKEIEIAEVFFFLHSALELDQ